MVRLFIASDSNSIGESNIWDWSGCKYVLEVFVAEVGKRSSRKERI